MMGIGPVPSVPTGWGCFVCRAHTLASFCCQQRLRSPRGDAKYGCHRASLGGSCSFGVLLQTLILVVDEGSSLVAIAGRLELLHAFSELFSLKKNGFMQQNA